MTEGEKTILEDMKGFIEFAIEHDKSFLWTLANLGHDINGLLNQEPAFSPRTAGYSKPNRE